MMTVEVDMSHTNHSEVLGMMNMVAEEKDFVAGEGMDFLSLEVADLCDRLGNAFYCEHSITQEEYSIGLSALGFVDNLLTRAG